MLYQRRTFTCPASSGKTTSESKWDLAFLNREDYKTKYEIGDEQYETLAALSTFR